MRKKRQSTFLEAEEKILVAGFGGQGIMFLGRVIAEAAVLENNEVSYIRSYGAEMRGGTAHCQIKISKKEIASPVFASPTLAIIMNQPSWSKFQNSFIKETVIFLNGSLIRKEGLFKKERTFIYPFNEIASSLGEMRAANIVALGVFIKKTKIIKKKSVTEVLKNYFASNPHLYSINLNALEKGWQIS